MKTILTAKSSNLGSTHVVGEHLTLWLRGTRDLVDKLVPQDEDVVCDTEVIRIMKNALEEIGNRYEKLLNNQHE